MDIRTKDKFAADLFQYLREDTPTLKELYELKVNEIGLSQRQVESVLGVERKTLLNILNQEAKRIDVVNLMKIGAFIGKDFEETLKIFTANLHADSIKDVERARRLIFIAENFDLKNLKSIKFFDSINDFDKIEEKIKHFFGIDSIFDYENKIGAAFSRTKKSLNNLMLDFWVKSAHAYLSRINNPNDYDRNQLKDLIPKMKPYSQDEKKGLQIVSRALYSVGVTVVFQPYLPNTQVRGATLVIDDKPCIVLTNFNKNYATLWFALMHELYHVLIELDKIKENVFHLTGEPNIFLMDEDGANNFARQYYLSTEKSQYIFRNIHNKLVVSRYAKQNQIHPSLIYNFFCYENPNYWGAFKKYIPDTRIATKNLNINIWESETLDESVIETKELILNSK